MTNSTLFNSTAPIDFVSSINVASGGFLGSILLVTFFAVAFISLKNFEMPKAFAAASFFTLFIALIFKAIGLIGSANLYFTIVVSGISVLVLYLDK